MQRLPRWTRFLLLALGYTAVAIFLTSPLVQNINTHLAGRTTDAMVHYWNSWWVQQALGSGQFPWVTSLLSYPETISLVTHNFAWFTILPWLLLEPIIGGIVAYNLVILLTLVLCGLAMYGLASDLLHDSLAAFLAGLIYMAWPFRLSQLDHPNLISTFWVPIFFLFLGRLLRNGRRRDAVLTGATFALVGYTRWQFLVPVFLMGLVYALLLAPRWRSQWRSVLVQLTLAAIIGLLLLLPPVYLLIQEQNQSDIAADVLYPVDEQIMTTDLLAYITPPRRSPAFNAVSRPLYDSYYPDRTKGRRYPAFIGFAVLALVIIALVKRWRESYIWLIMALVLIGLAAGMAWRINGQFYTAVPTLYRLLAPLEFARLIRIPERYIIFLALPTSILAATGWQVLLNRLKNNHWRNIVTLLLAILIIFEYRIGPAKLQYVGYDKSWFEQIAAEAGDGAILNLPLRFRFSKEYMFDQTFHGRPILQGHISREPENLYRFIENNAWIGDLQDLNQEPASLMTQLNQAGVEYVVLNKYLLEEPVWQNWLQQMPYPPVYENDRYLIYATTT